MTEPIGGDELTAARRELATVKAELAGALASYKTFAYAVSHDFRAPMRAIAGFASMLDESAPAELPDEARHFLTIIRENVQLLTAQMDGLLSLSRLEHRELRASPVDMSVLTRVAADTVQALEPARDVAVTIDALIPVTADAAMVEIAMLELVKNAFKFTRRSEAAAIVIDSELDGRTATYRVRDNGVGFPTNLAGRLFAPFQRLHSPKEYEGLGIGLAAVKAVVTRHHGRVWAESEAGSGATFAFSLPATS